jgi:RNA polymerase sigma-70 factor (ECF subfamily)
MSTHVPDRKSSLSPFLLDEQLRANRELIWGLCYRMTGNAADADDLVQETFKRALEKPPRLEQPLKSWLTKVCLNLARDALRRRRRAPYDGPWLPTPIDTPEEAVAVEPQSTEGRYDLLESVSFAFLLALEALTPKQRAVLLLRDVFDYSVRETAQALGVSGDDVKTSHLRARRAMAGYDGARSAPTAEAKAGTLQTLNGLLEALLSGDVAKVEALLSADVLHLSDGGGQYAAARVPLKGPSRVARFLLGVAKMRGAPSRAEIRWLNGFPALVAEYDGPLKPHHSPRVTMGLDVGADGKIRGVHTVLADAKLERLFAATSRTPS